MLKPFINILDGSHTVELNKHAKFSTRSAKISPSYSRVLLKKGKSRGTLSIIARNTSRQVPVFQSSYRGFSHMRNGHESMRMQGF